MAEFSFESIRPNIVRAVQEGATMRCVFGCPVTGVQIEAHAHIERGQRMGDAVRAAAQQSLLWSVRNAIVSGLRSVLGYGVLGSVGADAAGAALGGVGQGAPDFSEEDRQVAIVRAFQGVAARFTWDGRRFVAAEAGAEAGGDFMCQLQAAPVTQRYDRAVLARMLVEVASADGKITDEEREILGRFIAPDLGTAAELGERPALSRAELEETSPATRETSLMVAWAAALVDRELDAAERGQLAGHAQGLGIPAERATELKRHAQHFVLEQALERAHAGGRRDEAAVAEALAVAERIGLPREEAERAEVRYRKRHGLV